MGAVYHAHGHRDVWGQLRPSYEVESVPIERSMPAAPESSRGVDKQACTEAVAVQANARYLHTAFYTRIHSPMYRRIRQTLYTARLAIAGAADMLPGFPQRQYPRQGRHI